MINPQSSVWRTGTLEERRQLVDKHHDYHTTHGEKVWHSDPECAAGKQIWSRYLRGGKGDKEQLCRLCKGE